MAVHDIYIDINSVLRCLRSISKHDSTAGPPISHSQYRSLTKTPRIIFRALQGLGASGAFSISTSIIYVIVPKAKLPIYGGLTFMFVALATVTGPLLGGAIDSRTTWRWIFLLK